MIRFQPLTILLFGFALLLAVRPGIAADPNEFLVFDTPGLPGRLYVPPEAQDSARPVILFLHGAGETGSDNRAQINGNIDNLLAAAKQRGAFLYAPQATSVAGRIDNWSDSSRTTTVMTMLDRVLAEQNVDPNRVYVTGLSMGGGGAWTMASRYADRFAASVPIAGVSPAGDFNPGNLVGLPTWAFHARDDGVVSKNISRNVINRILSIAGESALTFPPNNDRSTTFEFVSDTLELNYTEWPTGGHGIWPRVYNSPEVYDWMFSHRLVPEPSSAVLLAIGVLAPAGEDVFRSAVQSSANCRSNAAVSVKPRQASVMLWPYSNRDAPRSWRPALRWLSSINARIAVSPSRTCSWIDSTT